MQKIATLLLSFMLITPAQAETNLEVSTVRTAYVYSFARQACPKDLELSKLPNNQHLEFLSHVARLAHMTNEETWLLIQMCFIYQEGVRRETS